MAASDADSKKLTMAASDDDSKKLVIKGVYFLLLARVFFNHLGPTLKFWFSLVVGEDLKLSNNGYEFREAGTFSYLNEMLFNTELEDGL